MPILSSLTEVGRRPINIQELASPDLEEGGSQLRSIIKHDAWDAVMNFTSGPTGEAVEGMLSAAHIIAQATGYIFDRTKMKPYDEFKRDQEQWLQEMMRDGSALSKNTYFLVQKLASFRQLYGRDIADFDRKIIDYVWDLAVTEINKSGQEGLMPMPATLRLIAWFNAAFPANDRAIRYVYSDTARARLHLHAPTEMSAELVQWSACYKMLFPQEMTLGSAMMSWARRELAVLAHAGDWISYAMLARNLAILSADDVLLTKEEGIKLVVPQQVVERIPEEKPPSARSF